MAKRKRRKKDTVLRKILRGAAAVLFFIVMVGLMTSVTVGGFFYLDAAKVANSATPQVNLENERQNQNLTTIIYATYQGEDGKDETREYARLHGEINREWLEMDKLEGTAAVNPTTKRYYISDAYVALEDKRFYEHHGVDWRRLVGVISDGLSGGASTITQQLIKNVTGHNEVTAIRKYNEIIAALNLEKNYPKETILEAYLNTLYLGRGCYGIKTGANRYFGKEVDQLNLAECAALASITKAPNKYDPLSNPENNRERQLWCMTEMLNQGLITQKQYDEAKAFPLVFKAKSEIKPAAQPEEINNSYVDYIIETVAEDLQTLKGYNRSEAIHKIYNGGLKVYAAVDPEVQDVLEDVFRNRTTFERYVGTSSNPINPAMTVMDYKGRVVGIIGQAGKKTSNRSLNRAFQSWRPPGSTIKPLAAYGPAIEKNLITWSTLQLNEAFPYKGNMWPHNVDGTYGTGQKVTTQYAVMQSLNTVAARTVKDQLGGGNEYKGSLEVYNYLDEHFGFKNLDPERDVVLPAMSVGGMTNGFSTLEECAAYASFGNGGVYYEPYCYTLVTDHEDNPILEPKFANKRAFSEDTAKIMNEMLQTVDLSYYVVNGNNKYLSKFKTFGKTGTTNDNKDRWFAGGTPFYVASSRFGFDTPIDLNKALGSTLTNPAAKIWQEVFNRIHKNINPKDKAFPTTTKAVQKTYCKITGDLAGTGCYSTASGWYRTRNLPKTCTVCNGAPPDETEPGEGVTLPNTPGAIVDWIDRFLGSQTTTTAATTQSAYEQPVG
ncbi:MAG: transglycosylase domain-containing protein [Oscillospiraceae bacterium]|jgi:penicillin-binding protein 1A|nr:transglycosylase domain-containing protein [Oscillospiraceae bacterium]